MQDDANIQNLKEMLTNEIMINNENKDNELSAEKEIIKEGKQNSLPTKSKEKEEMNDFADELQQELANSLNYELNFVPSKNSINSQEKENDKLGITNISKFNSTRNFEDTDSEDDYISEKFDHSLQDKENEPIRGIPKDIPKSSLIKDKTLDSKPYNSNESQANSSSALHANQSSNQDINKPNTVQQFDQLSAQNGDKEYISNNSNNNNNPINDNN